jgi:hypothetical protein
LQSELVGKEVTMPHTDDATTRDDTNPAPCRRLDATDAWCLQQRDTAQQVTAYDEQWFQGRPRRP